MIDWSHVKRTIRNIYQTFRCCGVRLGMRVTWRILFPKKPSKELMEFSKKFTKEDLDKLFEKGCSDDRKDS